MATAALMQKARIAIREGRLVDARRLLRQVIHEEPLNHAAWLLLARATPDKNIASEYIERARQLQPESPLVQSAVGDLDKPVESNRRRYSWHIAPVLIGIMLLIGLVYISFGAGSGEQVTALQNDSVDQNVATPEQAPKEKPDQAMRTEPGVRESVSNDLEAVPAPKPTSNALPTPTLSADAAREITSAEKSEDSNVAQETGSTAQVAADADQALPAAILMGIETEDSSREDGDTIAADDETADASQESNGESENGGAAETEEDIDAAIVDDAADILEQEQGVAESADEAGEEENTTASGERWIDVNLTTQTLVAYEGETPVLYSTISSGLWQFPTVTGQFRTWMKYDTQNMTGYHLGYNYEIPDVPYVMYFFEDYAIHGAYWHNNFGTPMSHGCVNMNVGDAEWLYSWAPLGTLVDVHQ